MAGCKCRDGMATWPVSSADAIHVIVICVKLLSMYGSNMPEEGCGCMAIIVSAIRVCGPHSFECGQYVMDSHFVQVACIGKKLLLYDPSSCLIDRSVSS